MLCTTAVKSHPRSRNVQAWGISALTLLDAAAASRLSIESASTSDRHGHSRTHSRSPSPSPPVAGPTHMALPPLVTTEHSLHRLADMPVMDQVPVPRGSATAAHAAISRTPSPPVHVGRRSRSSSPGCVGVAAATNMVPFTVLFFFVFFNAMYLAGEWSDCLAHHGVSSQAIPSVLDNFVVPANVHDVMDRVRLDTHTGSGRPS
jgi:hypothetical protein